MFQMNVCDNKCECTLSVVHGLMTEFDPVSETCEHQRPLKISKIMVTFIEETNLVSSFQFVLKYFVILINPP
jgi:hypothetical protein